MEREKERKKGNESAEERKADTVRERESREEDRRGERRHGGAAIGDERIGKARASLVPVKSATGGRLCCVSRAIMFPVFLRLSLALRRPPSPSRHSAAERPPLCLRRERFPAHERPDRKA